MKPITRLWCLAMMFALLAIFFSTPIAHWLRLPLQGRSTGPHWRATPGLLASSEGGNPLQDVPVWCDVITGVKATHGCQFLEDKQ